MKKIKIGDIVLAGCNKAEARVVGLNEWGRNFVVKYLPKEGGEPKESDRKYRYDQVEFVRRPCPKLYTILGGTLKVEVVAEDGAMAWVKWVDDSVLSVSHSTVPITHLREILQDRFIYCEIVGTNMCVWKRRAINNLPKAGDHFLTESGNVLTVLSIQKGIPEFSKRDLMDPAKIPFLEGKKIKFV